MSIKLCCSLCCTLCNDYKYLENEAGEYTEVYEITVKYFDYKLITEEEKSEFLQEKKVLCGYCWVPIKEFHEFQQNVIKTRSLLLKSEAKQMQLITEGEINLDEDNVNIENEKYIDRSDENDEDYRLETINIKSEEIILEADNVNIENEKDFDRSDENDEDYRFETINIKSEEIILEADNDNIENEQDFDISDEDNEDHRFENINNSSDLEVIEEKNATSNDEDEIPLINWRTKKVCVKKTNVKEAEDSTKGGMKSKNIAPEKCNQIENVEETSDLDESSQESKKPKQNDTKNQKGNSKSNFDKARESDALIRQWKPVLECDLCKETASSYDNLRNHFNGKHKERFYIKCCERKFYRRYFLVDHIQIHLNPETFKCDICGKVTTNKNKLKMHKKQRHEGVKNFERYKGFACKECGKVFLREFQLKCHIETVHKVDRVCDQCGETVHGIRAFKEHLMDHGISVNKFPCDECGAELASRVTLRRHKNSFHRDRPTIYVCSICDKVMAHKGALLEHKRYVHGERKYKCTYCDKAFKRPKNLNEHIATHTGQNLYQCPHCPRTFNFNANMYIHRKKFHPVEWEKGRKSRLQVPKVDINNAKKQIVF